MYYCYLRKSTEKQQETSFEVQEKFLINQATILKEDYSIVKETGSGSNTEDRPIFQNLLKKVKAGDIIGVFDSSRFARNTEDSLKITKQLYDIGVRLHVAGKFIDITNPIDKMVWSVQSSFDTYQRDIQRLKSQEGLNLKMQSGNWVLRGDFYGYETVKKRGITTATIIPEQADIIIALYKDYINGISVSQLSKKYIIEKYKIERILKCTIYMGYMLDKTIPARHVQWFSKDEIKGHLIKSNIYPAIVDEATWWAVFDGWRHVQVIKKGYGYRYSPYELTGILKCPVCNTGYAHNVKIRKSGKRVECYVNLQHKITCNSPLRRNLPMQAMESLVQSMFLITFLSGDEVSKFFAEKQEIFNQDSADLLKQFENYEKIERDYDTKIKKYIDLIDDIGRELLIDKIKELQSQKDTYSIQKASIKRIIESKKESLDDLLEEEATDVVDNFVTGDGVERKEYYKKYIQNAYVYADYLEVEFMNKKRYIANFWPKNSHGPKDMKVSVFMNDEKQVDYTWKIDNSIEFLDDDENTKSIWNYLGTQVNYQMNQLHINTEARLNSKGC